MPSIAQEVICEARTDGITIDRIRRQPGFAMPTKHLHNEYEIYYLLEGERYYFIDQQTYHVRKGSLVLIRPNQIHQTSPAGSGVHDRILIGLSESPFAEFFASTGESTLAGFFEYHSGVMELSEKDSTYVEALLAGLICELAEKKPGYRLMAMSRLSQLFFHIHRLRSDASEYPSQAALSTQSRHRKVDEVAAYITDHYDQPLSLENIATHFYISKCYLSRIFKEATGFTVNEYLNMNRIRHARHLLMNTDQCITAISEVLGYDSITYFERVFHKYAGISPSRYRKQYQTRLQPVRPDTYESYGTPATE